MKKAFKSFLYIIACVAVFAGLVKVYGQPFSSSPASAFEWDKNVNVYFGNRQMGSGADCSKVFPVARKVLNAETLGPGALAALLEGVNPEEKAGGYFTSVNSGVLVQRFEVKEGVAYVDFDSKFSEGVAGSCRVAAIKSQIENTLNNLPDIDSVVVSVNGETDRIFEP